ncbi:MAG: sensor histidine kinase [Myxococcota bacterium]
MVRELKHRVSNLFATVQAMVRMSAREADLPAADAEELLARIGAMATAHRVSLEAAGGPVPLHELFTAMLEQVGPISFEGPSVMLPEDKMTPVSLILHELSTNALKYGAWARPEGRVHIHWAVERPPKRLVLQWRESGLDDVDPTALSARGFGTRLIEGAAWQLDGRYTRSLSGGELCNLLTVPL